MGSVKIKGVCGEMLLYDPGVSDVPCESRLRGYGMQHLPSN